MKTEPYFYPQPNYLTSRTAIEREQKQFIKIAFAVHLSAVISAERYRSDSVALKSMMLTLVYFYIIMIVHKCQQSDAQSCSRTFELRVLPFGKTWEEPASEEYGKWKAREVEKQGGKEARRNLHDKKEKGAPDRTKKELNEN